jgi:hypothetical protein
MPLAKDIYGTAFKNGTAVLLARIVNSDGDEVQQADVSTVKYSVFEIDPCQPDNLTVVAGHDDVSLTVSDVIYDSLQTGGLWTVDSTGYNFRHEINVTSAEAFPKAGAQYQVRYELTPSAGQRTIVRFQLRVI